MNYIFFNLKYIYRNRLVLAQILNTFILYFVVGVICYFLNNNKNGVFEYSLIFVSGMGGVVPMYTIWYLPKKHKYLFKQQDINFFKIGLIYLLIILFLNIFFISALSLVLLQSFYLLFLSIFSLLTCTLLVIIVSYFNKYESTLNSLINKNINFGGAVILLPILPICNNKIKYIFDTYIYQSDYIPLLNTLASSIFIIVILSIYYLLYISLRKPFGR
jgi:hypothetical protein